MHYKDFLTVLVNVYCFDVVIYNEHIHRDIPVRNVFSHAEKELSNIERDLGRHILTV